MPDAFDKVNQRTVPATGRPALNANASVFAAGDAAKPKRKPRAALDAANVPIKSGVPIPPLATGPHSTSNAKTLLDRMKPGDCVELNAVHARSVKAYAKKVGIKVVTRKLADERFGVWRT
jgi:hypothetical protein